MESPRFTLHATAALVMHWGSPAFSGRAELFSRLLDLSSARDLIAACESECSWYGEVIANRKTAIRSLASEFMADTACPVRILIPAAGWSPLALELTDAFFGLLRIIEVDIAGMDEKQSLYQKVAPDTAGLIRCITADIRSPDHLRSFIPDDGLPLLIILEGITYFMDPSWIERLMETFPARSRAGYVIEYLLPGQEINPEGRKIADAVFSKVAAACSCPPPVRYSPGSLRETAGKHGFLNIRTMTVREMERLRTGENRYFPDDSDGWIAVSLVR